MGTIHGGLVSITFRNLDAEQIIDLVAESELKGIEWGGDMHVPHGDTKTAEQVGEKTRGAGLSVACYGSYYRAGESEAEGLKFADVRDSARALGADSIRVWAGRKGSADADDAYRQKVRDDLLRISDSAGNFDIAIEMEYHGNTLTDTNDSAVQLSNAATHPNLYFGWQPPNGQPFDYCLSGLRNIQPRLCHLHVFHWEVTDEGLDRRPLHEGASRWSGYLQTAEEAPGERFALIEFVRDGKPEQFLEDAAALASWLRDVNS